MAGIVPAGNLAGADPRTSSEVDNIVTRRDSIVKDTAPPETHGHNTIYLDSSITFEAYDFYAARAREAEKHFATENFVKQVSKVLVGKKVAKEQQPIDEYPTGTSENDPKHESASPPSNGSDTAPGEDRFGVTETEWEQAQRATRTVTWVTIFYLITTDILGPYNVPWAISRMGYGPGLALYLVFGLMAFYSGLQLWKMFIGLDSPRYPMRNFGDLGFRVYGGWARQLVNVLQSCQFFLNVTLLIESSGQGLQQMAAGKNGKGVLCFVAAEVIFMVCGFIFGQVRTLQRLGFLANLAVWLNVFVILMTMGVVPSFGPNYDASFATYKTPPNQPVRTSANWPEGTTLKDRINGLMNCVFAYGGATLFNELMAEMRRPMDFWKGLICADIFIFSIYITIGMVVYSYQGQYTFNPAYQGIPNSAYAWQTVGNAISFVSGLIAALLYGNIGVKVFYAAVLRDVFRFPPLDERKGKIVWIALVPIYWGLAFIVAASIPQISYLISFVGAAFILEFSYVFPPLFMVGYNVQKDAMLPEEHFDPATGQATRVDSGFKRWLRGYMKKPFLNTFDILYLIGALATSGLGIYASVLSMHESFQTTDLTPFTCNSPTG
ncbi:uncharacterized protein MYCFIDRAFT_159061 [Pseudocercospora fijiensis CIRAD86]|uniref:Amino acid transporter transmembrane domain-containing protein n=1 Tax=Pseudocercospora fijiensis (strain CIRAD86) TaxID=383855 RepID=N1Q804_PSEFD|nr:uncharacterized protein MYCFIDRAFT_159061 [Pseudocercospora fijiensis CIRAD86]EME87866.1 hypothetical protein MYCFIDRAFT_159061 [Pseudocercospora fijiensis CIRAD86]